MAEVRPPPPGMGVSVQLGSAEQIIVLWQPQEEVSDFVGVPGGWGSERQGFPIGGGLFLSANHQRLEPDNSITTPSQLNAHSAQF